MDARTTTEADLLPEELAGLVKPELQPGERLLWAAVARPRPPEARPGVVRPSLLALACFGLGSFLFYSILGPTRVAFLKVESLFWAGGFVLGFVGLVSGLVALAALAERRATARMTYALTDRRAIVWSPRKKAGAVEVFSFSRDSIKTVHRLEYPDGSGDIRFLNPMDENHYGPSGFEGIADVRLVEDLVRRTLVESIPNNPVQLIP